MIDQETKIFNKAMADYEKYKRSRALKALFEKEARGDVREDYGYARYVFCWLKTLICLLLNRTGGSYMDNNKFCIIAYDERYGMEGSSWDACWVSPYLFRDWNVCLASDGT